MVAEAIHSLVDTGNGLFVLLGVRLARRPPNREHPFGFGLDLYFWCFVVAIVVFAAGGGMSCYEGITRLRHPRPLQSLGWNYAVLAAALVCESTSAVIAYREFRKRRRGDSGFWRTVREGKDPTTFMVLFEDGAAILGILFAAAGTAATHLFDAPFADAIASLAIGLLLATVAILLARECRGLLLGESAAPGTVDGVAALVEDDPAVDSCERPLTLHFGPDDVLLAGKVRFRPELDGAAVAEAVLRLEEAIRRRYPRIRKIFLSPDGTENRSANARSVSPVS